jgi:serine/threonine protein kinase
MPAKLVTPEQWQQIKSIFDRAVSLPPAGRVDVLAEIADLEVRGEAASLLSAHDEAGDFLEAAAMAGPQPGHRFGPYEILELIGSGGMGEVYRARDARLGREVAIKVLRNWTGGEAARVRFLREARAIAALSHPNVLAIFDVGEANGQPYLVTELLSGKTLRAQQHGVRADGLSIREVVSWGAQIAHGLAAAHAAGLVHRDLKPENVFLLPGGEIKILDFGLALAGGGLSASNDGDHDLGALASPGMTGLVMGTAGYLSPEQARGEPVTAAADLFALGAILFELVTGTRAFPGATAAARTRSAIEHEPPAVSSVRPDVPLPGQGCRRPFRIGARPGVRARADRDPGASRAACCRTSWLAWGAARCLAGCCGRRGGRRSDVRHRPRDLAGSQDSRGPALSRVDVWRPRPRAIGVP